MFADEFNASSITMLSNATARTTTFTSPVIDARDFDGDICVLQNIGTVSGTSPTCATVLQDSDDGSTGWAAVDGGTFTTVTASNNSQKLVVQANACRRYLRSVSTIGGTTPSFILMIMLLARGKAT